MLAMIHDPPEVAKNYGWWYRDFGGIIIDVYKKRSRKNKYFLLDNDWNKEVLRKLKEREEFYIGEKLIEGVLDGRLYIAAKDLTLLKRNNEEMARLLHPS